MKELIAAAAAAAGAVILRRKKKISAGGMLLVLALAAAGLLYCLCMGFPGELIPVSSVQRGEKGSASEERDFQVEADGAGSRVTLEIPSVQLDAEEAEAEIAALMERLEQEVLGKNVSLLEICYPLVLTSSYPDSQVEVRWQTDAPDYLSWEGNLGGSVPEEGAEVLLTGELRLQESSDTWQRRVKVFPSRAAEDLADRIRWEAEELNRDGQGEEYLLPDSLDEKTLRWYRTSDSTGWLILCLALFLLGALLLVQQEKAREEERTRQERLDQGYPELVSRLQMLLGAGLSMRMAMERIGTEYKASLEQEEKRKGKRKRRRHRVKRNPVYEEVLVSLRELDNGMSETEVYRRFGTRCGTPSYRGLSLLLEQNMTKGGQGLLHLLEQEALEAFEARQRRARQEGEKVSVRLLLPMGIMLCIVLALIMIPAFMTIG